MNCAAGVVRPEKTGWSRRLAFRDHPHLIGLPRRYAGKVRRNQKNAARTDEVCAARLCSTRGRIGGARLWIAQERERRSQPLGLACGLSSASLKTGDLRRLLLRVPYGDREPGGRQASPDPG